MPNRLRYKGKSNFHADGPLAICAAVVIEITRACAPVVMWLLWL